MLLSAVWWYRRGLGLELQAKRQQLQPRLEALGLSILPAQGTYFLTADMSSIMKPGEDDVALCKRLTVEAGVTLIPISAFYASDSRPHNLVRFCFCKEDAKLDAACEKLAAYIQGGQQQQQQQQQQ
jgi:aspartate/methionine/tyrosine aminotransferase